MMQNYNVRCVHVPAAGANPSKQHGLEHLFGQTALESRHVSKKSLCHQSSKPTKDSLRNGSQNPSVCAGHCARVAKGRL